VDSKIKLPSNRNFGIVFFFFFLIIALWPLIKQNEIRYWSVILSIIFLILGIINSKVLTPLNKVWFKIGIILGNIISPIVLSLIFYLIVTPTAIILKLFGKDVLNLKNKNSKSYWIEKDSKKNSMKDQF
tara:strand:+ start:273 stop:659 length:387 start_codon:yes stop_codon:yes gene_type:complete